MTWNHDLLFFVPRSWVFVSERLFIACAFDIHTYCTPDPEVCCIFVPPFVASQDQFEDILFDPRW